jgi:predicted ribosomally synthesized peptide with SipW-like signal peptide
MLRKLAGIMVVAGLSFGLIGAGVSATFTDQLQASQPISVGTMNLKLEVVTAGSTVTSDGKTLTCPAVHIITASGPYDTTGACGFKVVSTGDIQPSQVTVKMVATTNGADLSKFGIAPSGLLGSALFYTLKATEQTIGHVFGPALPVTVSVPLSWGENAGPASLDNLDMGKWVVVSYTVEAFGG